MPRIVYPTDVLVGHLLRETGLAAEPLHRLPVPLEASADHLQSNGALELAVTSFVDHAHAALAEAIDYDVAPGEELPRRIVERRLDRRSAIGRPERLRPYSRASCRSRVAPEHERAPAPATLRRGTLYRLGAPGTPFGRGGRIRPSGSAGNWRNLPITHVYRTPVGAFFEV